MPLSPSRQNQEHYSPLASIHCHPLSNSESGSLGLFHFPCSKTPQSSLSKLRAPSSFLLHPQILLTVELPTPARRPKPPRSSSLEVEQDFIPQPPSRTEGKQKQVKRNKPRDGFCKAPFVGEKPARDVLNGIERGEGRARLIRLLQQMDREGHC